jgi:subtilisin family serine protease
VNRFLLRLCFVLSLSPGLFSASAHAQPRTKPVSLFTDKDMSAWELITLPANAVTTPAWHFDSYGVLAVTGKPVSYLVTKASYSNYRLHVEWRWPVGAAKNSNSGVLLHIASGPTNDSAWPLCFQMQLKVGRAGDLLPMAMAKFAEKLTTPPDAKTPQLDRLGRDSERPLGEWNVCDIVCVGDSIEVTVNGVLQNRVTQCSPSAGRVGIQLEGTPYELRNIRLLPPK